MNVNLHLCEVTLTHAHSHPHSLTLTLTLSLTYSSAQSKRYCSLSSTGFDCWRSCRCKDRWCNYSKFAVITSTLPATCNFAIRDKYILLDANYSLLLHTSLSLCDGSRFKQIFVDCRCRLPYLLSYLSETVSSSSRILQIATYASFYFLLCLCEKNIKVKKNAKVTPKSAYLNKTRLVNTYLPSLLPFLFLLILALPCIIFKSASKCS